MTEQGNAALEQAIQTVFDAVDSWIKAANAALAKMNKH